MSIHYYSPLANEVTNADLLLLPPPFCRSRCLRLLKGVRKRKRRDKEIVCRTSDLLRRKTNKCRTPDKVFFVWWEQTIVWRQQTMVWWEQTMVWREQTIVWRQQTTQRSTEGTEKCANRQKERGEVHALTPHHQ